MCNNNEKNSNDDNIKNENKKQKPPLPRHDLTSRVSEVFELINTENDNNN